MRTTLTLQDEVYHLAVQIARTRRQSLGDTISDLVRSALHQPVSNKQVKGLTVFALPKDAPTVSTHAVQTALAEDY